MGKKCVYCGRSVTKEQVKGGIAYCSATIVGERYHFSCYNRWFKSRWH